MDRDGYPEAHELDKVRAWPESDLEGLVQYARTLCWMPEACWREEGDRLRFSTGGWSGNEDLVSALVDNQFFWALCWVSVKRGGHYEFELPWRREDLAGKAAA